MAPGQIAAARTALAEAERRPGAASQQTLVTLAAQLEGEVRAAKDGARVAAVASTVRDLSSERTALR
jgi:hypothetical protein